MKQTLYNLIYSSRRAGLRIDTRERTIFKDHPFTPRQQKFVDRLSDYGFVVQTLSFATSKDSLVYISGPINSMNPITGKPYDIKEQQTLFATAEPDSSSVGIVSVIPSPTVCLPTFLSLSTCV